MSAAGQIRIGINAHLLSTEAGYRRAGIHHYIIKVLSHLPLDLADLEFTVFTRAPRGAIPNSALNIIRTDWPTEQRLLRIIWEQFAWPWVARREELTLLHSMAFVTPILSSLPAVVTVYDLSFLLFPERFPFWQRFYLTNMTRRSCRKARRVVTISESSRQDIHTYFDVPLARIDVVQPGVDEIYHPLPVEEVEHFRQREGLPERFILHVGTLQPRKNLPVLLRALARIGDPALQLVLVGGKGWFFDELFTLVRTLKLEDRVRFAGYVADEDLPLWYSAADLLVFPSVYEGFGMPVLEAMACGTPVIAANTSSLPEAGGDAALLFAPSDEVKLADHITAVLEEPALSHKMRTLGFQQAKKFTWERAGRQMVDHYRRALDTHE